MARSMLGGAISKAASAAAAELSLVMGVQKDIWFIKDELKTMQAFLAAAEATKNRDMLLKVWAEQVRDLSYNIEDCLDEFMVHVRSQSLTKRLMKLKDRRRIAIQIRNLKARVEEVSSRNARYNLIKTWKIFAATQLATLMCGVGKTTLATKIYESDVANKFSSCAWITISQPFCRIEFLKDMFKKLLGDEALMKQLEGKVMREEDLAYYLRIELLEKRYFVVLDDLRNIDAWSWIKYIVFPSSNKKGSRIVVTTRDLGVANQITLESLIYHLEPPELVDATNLLLRKSRKTHEDMKKVENFKDILEQLVKKCGHLPLALLTIGGILATRKIAEWGIVYN
ncbi:unnamed protein product [Triticum turgidum subsp. durum]|uniref:Uncharacterized protein n=1 Tax=Triticum turgidum subsp. durum TaxID=4567 RepID=A0A9R0W6N1_TRITD|nr:unnamed protein product [Triticum turgidum subsp. durum]